MLLGRLWRDPLAGMISVSNETIAWFICLHVSGVAGADVSLSCQFRSYDESDDGGLFSNKLRGAGPWRVSTASGPAVLDLTGVDLVAVRR